VRWAFALIASLVGVGLAAAGVYVLRDGDSEELRPDLDQAVPSTLSVIQEGDSYRLTFASAVDNVGLGPLLIEGTRPDRETPSMTVRQLVRRADGSERSFPVPGRIRYVRSETHSHWHLLRFDRYELRRASDGELVVPDRKTGFCLGDRYDTNTRVRIENEPDRAVLTGECGRGSPGLLAVTEGISPGYGDDYVPRLEGQYLDVTSVPPGRYLLVHQANPDRALRESEYGNNAASVLLQLRRTGQVPSIRVLARCPDSDRCAPRQSS
jgi:Lysyl oxidase